MKPTDRDWAKIIRGQDWDRSALLFLRSLIDVRLVELDQAPYRRITIIRKKIIVRIICTKVH